MHYDASRMALYQPEKRAPLPHEWFSGKPDALCAELSRLAYFRFEQDPEELKAALAAHGLGGFTPFVNRTVNTQAFGVTDAQGTAYVAFRGTQSDSPIDAITDAKFILKPWIGGTKVHSGFAEAFDPPPGKVRGTDVNPRKEIATWLAGTPRHRLVCTGHSLGAALATLLAADHGEAELVTFGSPRVGDGAFAALFHGRTGKRFVDCTDGVTLVPPPVKYAHVGEMLYIDRNGDLQPEGIGDAAVLADRAAGNWHYGWRHAPLVWRNVLFRTLADHAPINYISALLGMRGN